MSPTPPRFFAHRFGRAYGPDSARSTLAHVLTGPVDGLETDCCLTADGRLAVLHVPFLPSSTTIDGWADGWTAADIVASQVRDRRGPVDEHPLLLEDLWPLLEGQELTVQLEAKAVLDRELADRTCQVVCESLAADPPVSPACCCASSRT